MKRNPLDNYFNASSRIKQILERPSESSPKICCTFHGLRRISQLAMQMTLYDKSAVHIFLKEWCSIYRRVTRTSMNFPPKRCYVASHIIPQPDAGMVGFTVILDYYQICIPPLNRIRRRLSIQEPRELLLIYTIILDKIPMKKQHMENVRV